MKLSCAPRVHNTVFRVLTLMHLLRILSRSRFACGVLCGLCGAWCLERGLCSVWCVCCVWCVVLSVVCVVCVVCVVLLFLLSSLLVVVVVGCGCGRGVVWAVTRWKRSVCTFETSPCVPATGPHVLYMWTCSRYTRGRFELTHGSVLNLHTKWWRREGSSPVLLTKQGPRGVFTFPTEVHQKQPTTCHRFLPSFAISDKGVPLQLS